MLKIQKLKTLMKLTANNKINDLALVKETNTLYKWDGANWIIQSHTGIDVSLFELNQGVMTTMPPYTNEQRNLAKNLIDTWHTNHQGNYYMLLSNEQHYYTVFHIGNDYNNSVLEDAVIDCLDAIGEIKDISKNEDDVIECWVTVKDTSYVYYLFNYDEGVVECV